jgi:hypothetical protein
MYAWQPDVELIKHLAIGHTSSPKQFCFRDFKEAKIRAVKDNSRGVNVAPQDAFFN